MTVSVLIPTYNCGKYLPEALESVLSQTYTDYDVTVIDDGSEDDTRAVCAGYRGIRYLYQPHGGISAARNAGLRSTGGKLVAFLDADDRWDADKLRLQTEYLDAHPDVSLLFSRYQGFTDIPEEELTGPQKALLGLEVDQSMVTALIRRELFDRVGAFDTDLPHFEDSEWLFRVRISCPERIAKLDRVLYYRRIHENNVTLTHEDVGRQGMRPIIARAIRNLKRGKA